MRVAASQLELRVPTRAHIDSEIQSSQVFRNSAAPLSDDEVNQEEPERASEGESISNLRLHSPAVIASNAHLEPAFARKHNEAQFFSLKKQSVSQAPRPWSVLREAQQLRLNEAPTIFKEFEKIKQTKVEIFDHPSVQAILSDKQLQTKTLLSKYTLLENTLGNITLNSCLFKRPASESQNEIQDLKSLLIDVNQEIKQALGHLDYYLLGGDSFVNLRPSAPSLVVCLKQLPRFFRVSS